MPLIPQQGIISVPMTDSSSDNAIDALNRALEDWPQVRIISVTVATNQKVINPRFANMTLDEQRVALKALPAPILAQTKIFFDAPDRLIAVIETV